MARKGGGGVHHATAAWVSALVIAHPKASISEFDVCLEVLMFDSSQFVVYKKWNGQTMVAADLLRLNRFIQEQWAAEYSTQSEARKALEDTLATVAEGVPVSFLGGSRLDRETRKNNRMPFITKIC